MKNETILLSPLHFQKPLDGLQVDPNIPIYLFILIDWYYDHIDFTHVIENYPNPLWKWKTYICQVEFAFKQGGVQEI
jgi:hypothetical protein